MSFQKLSPFTPIDRRLACFGRVLGHPARIEILRLLAVRGPIPYADLKESIPMHAKTLSRHLQYLVENRCILGIPDGARSWFGIDDTRLGRDLMLMKRFLVGVKGGARIAGVKN